MRKVVLTILLCTSLGYISFAQTPKIDSLSQFLNTHNQKDTLRVNALNSLAFEYQNIDLDKTKDLLEEAEKISVEINYPKGVANSLYNLGFYSWNKGNYDTSLILCNRALSIFTALNLKDGEIKCFNRIAAIHNNIGNYKTSIEYYYKCLSILDTSMNYSEIGKIYNNISVMYGDLYDYDKALEYSYKALKSKQKLNDVFSIGVSINNIGYYNLKANYYDKAHKYLKQSLTYNSDIENNYVIGITNQNLGSLYDIYGKYDSAFIYHKNAIKLLLEYGSQGQISRSYFLMGNHYLLQNENNKAIEYAEKALEIALKTDEKDYILNSYKILYKAHKNLKNHEKALNYFLNYKQINDELKKDENIKRLAIREKELEIKLEKEKTDLEIENQKKQKLLILSALFFSIILITLISFILIQKIKKNKQLKKANETRDKMFKIISHDFRSPLISISNTLQVIPELIKEKDYESAIRLSLKDEQSVSRVLSLIDNLINWTLSQNDDIPYHPQNYYLYDITYAIFDIYSPVAHFKKIEIINNIPKDIQVYCDKNILNTVLRNLINNAIKFTPQNGKITVTANIRSKQVEIQVTDTGIGIDKNNFDKIFSLDKNKEVGTKGEKGNGLGLFFCKEFIKKNKGDIWVESEVGKGSTFHFTIPVFSEK